MAAAEGDRLNAVVSRVLSGGVLLSGALLAAGLALSFGAARVEAGSSLLTAGIVAMIATPFLRIVALSAAFARAKEWRFFWATAALLGLLALASTAR